MTADHAIAFEHGHRKFGAADGAKEIVDQLNGYVRGIDDDPELRRRLDATFLEPMPMNADEFADQVKADAAKWERIVREAGVRVD